MGSVSTLRAAGGTGGSRWLRRTHRWDIAVSLTMRVSHPWDISSYIITFENIKFIPVQMNFMVFALHIMREKGLFNSVKTLNIFICLIRNYLWYNKDKILKQLKHWSAVPEFGGKIKHWVYNPDINLMLYIERKLFDNFM